MKHITITNETLTALDLMERLKPNIDENGFNDVTVKYCKIIDCEEARDKLGVDCIMEYIPENGEGIDVEAMPGRCIITGVCDVSLFRVSLFSMCNMSGNHFYMKEIDVDNTKE